MYFLKISKTFEKKAKRFLKKYPELRKTLEEKLTILQINPFQEQLKTHKLKGTLKEFYSCSLTYEYRIVFKIDVDEKIIELYTIGTHDEVY